MKKILTTTLSAVILSAGAFVPALAADSSGMLHTIVMFPVRATALVAGCGIGTPIAVLRMSAKDTKSFYGDMSGGGMPKKAAGALLALPVGMVEGTFQGCYTGPHNAIKNCVDKPFSKDSVSMGDLE